MPTSFSVGYDDLQPIARCVRLNVVPLLVGEPTRHTVAGSLDGSQHRLIKPLDLRVALDDVPPPLLSQIDHPPIGILDRRANRHDDPKLRASPRKVKLSGQGWRDNAHRGLRR